MDFEGRLIWFDLNLFWGPRDLIFFGLGVEKIKSTSNQLSLWSSLESFRNPLGPHFSIQHQIKPSQWTLLSLDFEIAYRCFFDFPVFSLIFLVLSFSISLAKLKEIHTLPKATCFLLKSSSANRNKALNEPLESIVVTTVGAAGNIRRQEQRKKWNNWSIEGLNV